MLCLNLDTNDEQFDESDIQLDRVRKNIEVIGVDRIPDDYKLPGKFTISF